MQLFKTVSILSLLFTLNVFAEIDSLKSEVVISSGDFTSTKISELVHDKNFMVIFSKNCPHCKEYFRDLKNCYKNHHEILAISVDQDKRRARKYWKQLNVPFKFWMASRELADKLSSMKVGMPFSYLVFKGRVYPVGAGRITCERISELSGFNPR